MVGVVVTTADRKEVYARLEAATCKFSGLSDGERHRHIQNIYVRVMDAKRQGPLVKMEKATA